MTETRCYDIILFYNFFLFVHETYIYFYRPTPNSTDACKSKNDDIDLEYDIDFVIYEVD